MIACRFPITDRKRVCMRFCVCFVFTCEEQPLFGSKRLVLRVEEIIGNFVESSCHKIHNIRKPLCHLH